MSWNRLWYKACTLKSYYFFDNIIMLQKLVFSIFPNHRNQAFGNNGFGFWKNIARIWAQKLWKTWLLQNWTFYILEQIPSNSWILMLCKLLILVSVFDLSANSRAMWELKYSNAQFWEFRWFENDAIIIMVHKLLTITCGCLFHLYYSITFVWFCIRIVSVYLFMIPLFKLVEIKLDCRVKSGWRWIFNKGTSN